MGPHNHYYQSTKIVFECKSPTGAFYHNFDRYKIYKNGARGLKFDVNIY